MARHARGRQADEKPSFDLNATQDDDSATVSSSPGDDVGPDTDADADSIRPADLERGQPPSPAEKPSARGRQRSKSAGRGASTDMRRVASNIIEHVASRITTHSLPEPPPPPDGGAKAWTQVAMGWLVIFCSWGYVNSFGTFQTYYSETMPDQSNSSISWIGSVQVWLTLLIGAFSGRALDAGYFLPTFFAGAVLQVLGIFLMSLSTKYWQLFLTQGLLTGIGGGIFFTPSLALVTTYFSKRRAIAMGIVTTSNSTGGAIYPVIVRQLLPQLGFAWTARVLGFINLACLAVAFTFMRPRLPPRKAGPVIDMKAFKEPVYVTYVTGMFCIMWANYYTFFYIADFGTDTLGMSQTSSFIMVILLNGAGIPFRLLPPLVAQRVGVLNVVVPVVFAWSVIAFCWLAVRSVGGYYAYTAFYGIASGSFQCMIPTAVASITRRLDMVGTRLGMAFSISSFAALTGPPIGGALITAGGGFTGAQAWAASMTTLGFVMFSMTRYFIAGRDLRHKC